jgi:hypothetical protein
MLVRCLRPDRGRCRTVIQAKCLGKPDRWLCQRPAHTPPRRDLVEAAIAGAMGKPLVGGAVRSLKFHRRDSRRGGASTIAGCNGVFSNWLDTNRRTRQARRLRGLICRVLPTTVWRSATQKSKTRLEGGLQPAEAGNLCVFAVQSFPKFRPLVKRKRRFRSQESFVPVLRPFSRAG